MKLIKIPYTAACQITDVYEANTNFLSIVAQNDCTPYDAINEGLEKELFSDTVTFLAHGLPFREAIWWAVCCAKHRTDWSIPEKQAIDAAESWVFNPDESSRRLAEKTAAAAGLETGAGWAAQAAFWSGGSMLAVDAPIIPPPSNLYAQAVAGCINLSAVHPDGENAKSNYLTFIEIGLRIAQGGNGKL
ncbi:Twin-arginine translocation pathway signal [Parashewanella spongiae]|uniref:Twin-arginine translocation pathway signal n=1 Tax=Parashewanella spongiae TaxID=342950 RepID=A0A3A6U5H8_9GAMM|nr:Twin-arginine translocation pathway signal [Parashewanella spongiae]MCL1076803.1 Twin-arginine translocation pathway signal [Parashewanella spongiae]RJY19273.1 Twin-arginine translocation pathway signal [Parashewanella spongiae]